MIRSPIRPLTTLAVVGVLCYGFLVGMVTTEAFLPIALLIIKWWFEAREEVRREPGNSGV